MKKKGQMKLSFGMIFSIILIIAFLVFAFYGIKNLLSFQEEATILQFKDNLQKDLDAMWKGSSGSQEVIYSLPKSVEGICFVDSEFGNMQIKRERTEDENINHLDIVKTIGSSDKLCFENVDGKVNFLLEKNYGEPLVKVSKI